MSRAAVIVLILVGLAWMVVDAIDHYPRSHFVPLPADGSAPPLPSPIEVSLISSQRRIDAQNYYANDRSAKRYVLESIVLFGIGCGLGILGACFTFFRWGGHDLRAMLVGAILIILGALTTGLAGYLAAMT